MAANKNDKYEIEQVKDEEGEQFAKQINAVFQRTSAKNFTGIEELFYDIGKKFLIQKGYNFNNLHKQQKYHKIRKTKKKKENNKGCC